MIVNRSAQAQGISVAGSTLTAADVLAFMLGDSDAGRTLRRMAALMGLSTESVTAKDDAFIRVVRLKISILDRPANGVIWSICELVHRKQLV